MHKSFQHHQPSEKVIEKTLFTHDILPKIETDNTDNKMWKTQISLQHDIVSLVKRLLVSYRTFV